MAILNTAIKSLLVSLIAFGLLVIVANAQPNKKKFAYKINKSKISFVTPALDLPAGKIVVSGEIKGADVSGGGGGCYTLTVTTYRLTPNGEKIPVRSRSKKVCLIDRLPELIIDQIPRGKYLVEIVIDRPLLGEGKLEGELEVAIQPERINLK
ncbi:MAG TPA: hypothetical protein PKY82_32170 [Pyrinomonadaceae bacterium]|nr:hypothetical protein [Pyrinomonadaceae bacterium]